MVGATDNNTNNENGLEDNKSNEENKNIGDFIKNPKTGDDIIVYVIIFILALITLWITKKKSDKKENK